MELTSLSRTLPQLGWIITGSVWVRAKTLFAPQTHILASAHFRFMELLLYVNYRLTFFKALFGCCFVVKVSQLGFSDFKFWQFEVMLVKMKVKAPFLHQSIASWRSPLNQSFNLFLCCRFGQLILLVRYNVMLYSFLMKFIEGVPSRSTFFEKLFLLCFWMCSVFFALFRFI